MLVFALPMLFHFVMLHTVWSGKSLRLLCILPFGMLCLSVISMMFVKIMWAMCMVFLVLCPVGFFVVGESPSVLF